MRVPASGGWIEGSHIRRMLRIAATRSR
jgi:hypothetical protein